MAQMFLLLPWNQWFQCRGLQAFKFSSTGAFRCFCSHRCKILYWIHWPSHHKRITACKTLQLYPNKLRLFCAQSWALVFLFCFLTDPLLSSVFSLPILSLSLFFCCCPHLLPILTPYACLLLISVHLPIPGVPITHCNSSSLHVHMSITENHDVR